MKIHEYQAKGFWQSMEFRCLAVKLPSRKKKRATLRRSWAALTVVKAQIHAGGRGKGGGVKLAKTPDEAATLAEQMLGMRLVTHQTGPEGRIVKRLLIEEGLKIKTEYYLGIVVDRATSRPVFMASKAGGMEIEKVAEETPD